MRRLRRWGIFLLPVAEVSYFQFVEFIPELKSLFLTFRYMVGAVQKVVRHEQKNWKKKQLAKARALSIWRLSSLNESLGQAMVIVV